MSLKNNKFVDFVQNIQHSLFMWFLLCYGSMYLIGIFATRNIYSKFEYDFTESIALQTLKNRVKNLNYLKDYLKINDENKLNQFLSSFNDNGINIFSIMTPIGSQKLTIENNVTWANINWDMIQKCAHKLPTCKTPLMRAYNLGLDHKYPNYFVYAEPVFFQNKEYININLSNPHKLAPRQLVNIRFTEHLSQLMIFLSFICTIFISYGAVRPINRFVKKIRNQKLNSENFLIGEENELNHVRTIRNTIFDALIRKEQEEKERLAMQNTLLSQQKEAEIGKIVSQISHDLKSPLIIFEDILREKSFDNFCNNFEAARRSLNKILSLVYSLKQADKESILNLSLSPFSLDSIVTECKLYAKVKNLDFETNIQIVDKNNPSKATISLLIDHPKIERSVNNLLRNAVEYAKSKVILDAKIENDNLILKIMDDGSGIQAEVLPRLFQWRNTGNVESGTGIGLYYAKQVALAHGGDLEYKQENGLTTFLLSIPGVLQNNHVQSYENSQLHSADALEQAQSLALEKVVVFFIQDKKRFDAFQEFMNKNELSCAFFNELSPEYENSRFLALYTDSSEAVLETFIESGVHIILSKETDTPQEIYERLIRFYPSLNYKK